MEVTELLSPSLFGERRVVSVAGAHELPADALTALQPFLRDPDPSTTLLLLHPGTGKGKAVLEAARAARAVLVACTASTRPEDRVEFVRTEIRRAGGVIAADAAVALVDAVGSDLRELATVSAQLVTDSGGRIDRAAVTAYHRGRAAVTGFSVADLAMVGKLGPALEALRWALVIGVAPVLLADALADGVRSVARVIDDQRGDPEELARRLALPPWKVRRALTQARSWRESRVVEALREVAALNAAVKGEAVDAEYAVEHAVRRIALLARAGR